MLPHSLASYNPIEDLKLSRQKSLHPQFKRSLLSLAFILRSKWSWRHFPQLHFQPGVLLKGQKDNSVTTGPPEQRGDAQSHMVPFHKCHPAALPTPCTETPSSASGLQSSAQGCSPRWWAHRSCLAPYPSGSGLTLEQTLLARILEWVAISFSWGSSWPKDQTQVSHIAGRFFTIWATREAKKLLMTCGHSLLQVCSPPGSYLSVSPKPTLGDHPLSLFCFFQCTYCSVNIWAVLVYLCVPDTQHSALHAIGTQ